MALDASTLADRWTVLSSSVLIRGCAIPLAWKVLRAHAKGSWRPYWEGLLERLQGSVPADWESLGSQADSHRPQPCLEQLPEAHIARKRLQRAPTRKPPQASIVMVYSTAFLRRPKAR